MSTAEHAHQAGRICKNCDLKTARQCNQQSEASLTSTELKSGLAVTQAAVCQQLWQQLWQRSKGLKYLSAARNAPDANFRSNIHSHIEGAAADASGIRQQCALQSKRHLRHVTLTS